MDSKSKTPLIIYSIWAVLSFIAVFLFKGLDAENITHVFLIVFLLLQYPLFTFIYSKVIKFSPKTRFILLGTIFAAIVELFFMISTPVHESLKITSNTSFQQGIMNYLIDLAFTLPFYVVLFFVVWFFINKYQFKLWEYIIVFAVAQSLGDGSSFFIGDPFALILLPYVMISYHAMNVLPFLTVKDNLAPKNTSKERFIVPVIAIVLLYLVLGILIQLAGSLIGVF